MKFIKKLFKYAIIMLFGTIGILLVLLITSGTFLFFDPVLLVNPKNIDYALKKTSLLKSWSWERGTINHKWIAWNHRQFSGSFQNLCLVYSRPENDPEMTVDTCMEKVSWNLDLTWKYGKGFSLKIFQPLIIESNLTKVIIFDKNDDAPTPDYLSYWNMLWGNVVPDLNFNFLAIDLLKNGKHTKFDLKLLKTHDSLSVKALKIELLATKKRITITAPAKILLPYELKTKNPIYFNELKLLADIGEYNIPILISGKLDTANLNIKTNVSREFLHHKPSKAFLVKHILQQASASLEVIKLVDTIKKLMKPPFNILPAPFNAMEGSLKVNLVTEAVMNPKDSVSMKITTALDIAGANQFVVLDLLTEFPYEIKNNSIGAIAIGLDLKKVALRLPKFSKIKLPPQLRPDPRFKGVKIIAENISEGVKKTKKIKKKIEYQMNLEALEANALQIKTNLLDEVLKLYFSLNIEDKTVKNGFISILPLKTTIFKRPIQIQSLKIVFNVPLEPELTSTIEFHLPEYLITLRLVGPLSKPRHAFTSIPPLPQDDIIAVLLFGRPLSALDADDKTTTKNANQIISQGILSLAVLYYLAGSPVESIGYDPDKKVVSAQFGLGSKNSLHVTSESAGTGLDSYGVRHSLGKGWYIDSTVQKNTDALSKSTNDYGVLLERIISY